MGGITISSPGRALLKVRTSRTQRHRPSEYGRSGSRVNVGGLIHMRSQTVEI